MKIRKRVIMLALAVVMLFSLSACGQKFDSSELTSAEQAAKAVVDSIEFNKGEELKEVCVLQAEDLASVLGKEADLSGWDISEAAYAVLLRVGEKAGSSGSVTVSADTAAADSTAASGTDKGSDKSYTSVALVSAENKVLYCSYTRGGTLEAAYVQAFGSDNDSAQEARYELAQKTIAADEYEQKNAEAVNGFNEAIADKLMADPDYCYTAEYINTAKSMGVKAYADMQEEIRAAEHRVKTLEKAENSDSLLSMAEAETMASTWATLEKQRWELLGCLADTQQKLDALTQDQSDVIAEFESKAAGLKADDPDYMYGVDYLKLCLSSEVNNQYDVYKRQIDIYSESIDNLVACMDLTDTKEIDHKCELLNTRQETESDYVNALKTYVQCIINKEAFEAENKAAIDAYDSALDAAKKKSGSDYAKDMDFIKADVQYGELIKQRDAHANAVEESKKAADQIKTEGEADVAELEEAYAEAKQAAAIKQAQANLLEYCKELDVTTGEYEAEAGQWGKLPQEYLDYQNPLLSYYSPPSSSYSGSGSSGSNKSSSSGSSSNKGAGGYDMPNENDETFSDYVKRVDPDLYDSMKDIYDSLK